MKPKANLRHFLTLAGSSLLATSSAALAQSTWDGDTNANWSDAGNWDTAPTDGVALTFSGVLNQTNANGGALANIGLLTLNGAGWNINLGTLTLNGGITASGTSALAGTLTLGAAQTWQNSTGLLTVTGNVTNGSHLLTVGGAGNTTITGVIGNGAGGLTKEGAGILTLNSANTYTGLTTVSGGELRWGIIDALASTGLVINNGGTANVQTFTDFIGAGGITLNQGGVITGTTGALSTGNGGLIANNGGTVSGFTTGALTLTGGSLTYNDTIVGSTTLSINRLFFGGDRTFTIADGDDASGIDLDITEYMGFSGAPDIGTTRDVIKEGSGVMRLSGSTGNSNRGASQTLINDGTLLLNKSGTVSAIGATGLVRVGDGTGSAGTAILRYTGASTNQISNSSALTINSDGLFDIADKTDTVGAVTLTGGSITGTTGVLTGTSYAVESGSISAILGGTNVTLDKTTAGTVTLSKANTYTGTTTVNGGELRWGIDDAISSGALTVNDGGTVNIQSFTDSVGALTIAKGGTITGTSGVLTRTGTASLLSNGGGSVSFSGLGYVSVGLGVIYYDTVDSTTLNIKRLQVTGSTFNAVIARGDDASGVDVNLDIFRNGSVGDRNLLKTGTGVLQLSGSVTSGTQGLGTSTTTINDGTVIFNKSVDGVAGWGSGLVTIGDGEGTAATAVLQYRTSSNQIDSNAITINSDGRFDLNGLNETTSGAVINNGSITTGAGTLTLAGTTATALTMGGTASITGNTTFSGANNATGITATGNTSIAGTLALGTANNRAIAVTGASDQLTVSAQLTGGTGRTLTKSGLGSLTLSSDNTGFAAAISVTGGTLLVNNTAGTGTGSGAVTVGTLGALGGSGTVGGAVTVDGALKPGNSTGLLTVGSLNLNASASTTLEINGLTRGAVSNGYDALGVNTGGSIDLEGALSFVFGNLSAFASNTDFDLFSFDTTSTGDFSGVTSTGFYAGTWSKTGDIWSLTDEGQTLNFSEVTGNLMVVPEPRAAVLGAIGLLALIRRRR